MKERQEIERLQKKLERLQIQRIELETQRIEREYIRQQQQQEEAFFQIAISESKEYEKRLILASKSDCEHAFILNPIINETLFTRVFSSGKNNNCLLYSLKNAGVLRKSVECAKNYICSINNEIGPRDMLNDDNIVQLYKGKFINPNIAIVVIGQDNWINAARFYKLENAPINRIIMIKYSNAHYEYYYAENETIDGFIKNITMSFRDQQNIMRFFN